MKLKRKLKKLTGATMRRGLLCQPLQQSCVVGRVGANALVGSESCRISVSLRENYTFFRGIEAKDT